MTLPGADVRLEDGRILMGYKVRAVDGDLIVVEHSEAIEGVPRALWPKDIPTVIVAPVNGHREIAKVEAVWLVGHVVERWQSGRVIVEGEAPMPPDTAGRTGLLLTTDDVNRWHDYRRDLKETMPRVLGKVALDKANVPPGSRVRMRVQQVNGEGKLRVFIPWSEPKPQKPAK